jgi:hypothetical protein
MQHYLHTFHPQIKAEQKEIIQNVGWKEKIQWQSVTVPTGFGKSMCYVSPFWTRYYIIFVFLMVICNSLLLLKSLPINIINCIKYYVNCSALTGAYDWQYKYLFVS